MLTALRIALDLTDEKFDLVYERYSLWSCEALLRAKHMGIPSVLEVNAPLIEEQKKHRELARLGDAETIRDRAFWAATSIVAVSESVAAYVRDHLPVSMHDKVHVVPNGVDTDRFHPDVPPQSAQKDFTIGFLGTLKPWHGLDSLLSAFELIHRRMPEATLRIVGDGPLRESLERQAQQQCPSMLARIQWMGSVHPNDVPGHLTALDVALAPYPESKDFYFSPLKIFEYMAAGRAIVASEIGQLQSIIDHDRNGLLYSPSNVRQLADRICFLADHAEVRNRLGKEARLTAVRNYSWNHTLQAILDRVHHQHVLQMATIASERARCLPVRVCEESR
jgi:glycosyltransferase involved in cell wall biosynthesis